jgi:predicted metalloprotease
MPQRLLVALLLAVTMLAPSAVHAQSSADLIVGSLDAFWAEQFAERGLPYSSPNFKVVSEPGTEFCGPIDVYYSISGYCASNRTISLSDAFVSPDNVEVILPILSHEFGHHIQNLTDTGITNAFESEQQADCFSGAFIQYAAQSDLISPALSAIALQVTQAAGDVWWAVPPDEAVHGNDAERAEAFLTGLQGGLAACGF